MCPPVFSRQVIYLTTPPCAPVVNSKGMSVAGLEAHMLTTCYHILHANRLAVDKFTSAGHSALDLHFFLQLQTSNRDSDGIHWLPPTHRLITNLLLTNLTLASSSQLPATVETLALERLKPGADEDRLSGKREELLLKTGVAMKQTILAESSKLKAKKLREPLAADYKAKVKEWRQTKLPAYPSPREKLYFSQLRALYVKHKNHPSVPAISSLKDVSDDYCFV